VPCTIVVDHATKTGLGGSRPSVGSTLSQVDLVNADLVIDSIWLSLIESIETQLISETFFRSRSLKSPSLRLAEKSSKSASTRS